MNRRTLAGNALGLLALAGMIAAGCSKAPTQEPRMTVKGKVTNAGQPLPIESKFENFEAARLQVHFIRTGQKDAAEFAATAAAKPDGSFEVQLPKGKYRIGLSQDYSKAAEQTIRRFDQRNSPIMREVTAEGQEINIDLSRPEG